MTQNEKAVLEPLALRYRPVSFRDVIGQKITTTVLSQMVETDQVPTGLLFSGIRGSGKTSTARILSNLMDADSIEIDAASSGSVADVRLMIESLRYSLGGKRHVILYDECQSMSREAFNALLKTLEEPPHGTTFILVTTEPDKVPDTVKDRLMEFVFHKVTASEIYDRLIYIVTQEKISVDDDLLVLIAERADGSVRDALMTLDQVWRAQIRDTEMYLAMVGEYDLAPALVAALMTGNSAHIFTEVEVLLKVTTDPSSVSSKLISCLRDLLILSSGGEIVGTGTGIEKRKELTLRLEPERILAALKLLWDLKTKIRSSTDARSNLDLALILVAEVFTRGKEAVLPVKKSPVQVSPQPEAPRRLSLAELG